MKSNSHSEEKLTTSLRFDSILIEMDKLDPEHKILELTPMKEDLKNALGCLDDNIGKLIDSTKSKLEKLNIGTYVLYKKELDDELMKLQTYYNSFIPHLKEYNDQLYKLLNKNNDSILHKTLKEFTNTFYEIIQLTDGVDGGLVKITEIEKSMMEKINL